MTDARSSATATATPPDTDLAARVVDAVKIYGSGDTTVTALDGVSVDFPRGEFTAVMGPSGSGKSTLIQCMAGLDSLTSGSTMLNGVELSTLNDRELTLLRRRQVGFVFQAFNLVPTLTLHENIELPIRLDRDHIDHGWLTNLVGRLGLADRMHHKPTELSGGQQQRGAVARALGTRPAMVFADEPTGNLDQKSGTEVLNFLREAVNEFNQSIVMVTHDAAAAAYADRVIFLVDGKIVRELRDPNRDSILDLLKELGDDTHKGA